MTDIKSYLPEFDDFMLFKRHHNRVKRFKNRTNQQGITFERAEDWFVQFIYQYYLHHGVDFLREQIDQKIESVKYREIVNDYINKAEAYKEQYNSDLEMYLYDIGEISYYELFCQYYPLNGYTLKAFVANVKDSVKLNEFAKMFAMAMWLMDNDDDLLYTYFQEAVNSIVINDRLAFANRFRRFYLRYVDIEMSEFNECYPKTSDVIKQLTGEVNIADESQFLSDGDFYLPWEYVTFMDGYMFVYHPSYPNGKPGHFPLKYDNDVCNKALNNIRGYIMKKLQPIRVTAKNSKIVAIQNINQISEAVEFLYMTTTNECVKLLKKEKSIAKSVSIHNQESSEVLKKLKLYKSKYLEYLSDVNLVSHKIFFALEARVNSSGISTTEVAFIFTLKQDKDHTMIVYENNLPARASVCFLVNTEYYDEAIDVINNFFSSDNINKREMLMSNSVTFDKTHIEKYFRVNHDDFTLWKLSINEI